jgi:DNA-binding transcriptional regulator YiaG
MYPAKKKRNNTIIRLREKNKLSFNYIARIVGLNVKTVFEIYQRDKKPQSVDNSAK